MGQHALCLQTCPCPCAGYEFTSTVAVQISNVSGDLLSNVIDSAISAGGDVLQASSGAVRALHSSQHTPCKTIREHPSVCIMILMPQGFPCDPHIIMQVGDINFDLSSPLKLASLNQARTQAVASAQAAAQLFAQQLSLTLGRIAIFDEPSPNIVAPQPLTRQSNSESWLRSLACACLLTGLWCYRLCDNICCRSYIHAHSCECGSADSLHSSQHRIQHLLSVSYKVCHELCLNLHCLYMHSSLLFV